MVYGASRCVGLRSLPPSLQSSSDRAQTKKKMKFDCRKRREIARLFAVNGSGECATPHELLAEASKAASIRFSESLRPDPVLIDLYAGCLISAEDQECSKEDLSPLSSHYVLTTKFIDNKILSLASGGASADEVKQIVLFSDGFDTRPYRIKWPRGTIIFHISSEIVSKIARQKLEAVGAKIGKTCRLIHVPSESPNLQAALSSRGFHGGSASSWVIQGFPLRSIEEVKEVLSVVSSLAAKGSGIVGELPKRLIDDQTVNEVFLSLGFAANTVNLRDDDDYENLIFVAEQLRFSDYQMEDWRREFQRMEDAADEDGFDDLF
ncbi:S-adenosyl-L-methionine-dependent methyltransferases superfamily protein [Wolffia australiana]